MTVPFSRLIRPCLAALVLATAPARAGEEIMPLVPGAAAQADSGAGADNAAQQRRVAAPDADEMEKPRLKVNVVKLTLPPITNPGAAAKIHSMDTYAEPAQSIIPAERIAKDEPASLLSPAPREMTAKSIAPVEIVAPTAPIVPIVPAAPGVSGPTAPATFSPIDYFVDIPGLVTPDVIARPMTPRAFTATTYSAQRDDLLDLVPMDAAGPQFLAISPALPVMPSYNDNAVATLEHLTLQPTPRKPQPARIHLPPPISGDAGLAFPGFNLPPPTLTESVPIAENPVSAAMPPARPALTSSLKPPESGRAAQPHSLRPPPNSGRVDTPAVAAAAPMAAGSPLLNVPTGVSLTASMPLTYSAYPEMGPFHPAPDHSMPMHAPAPRAQPQPAARKPAPPPRKAPAVAERNVPYADPANEQGFTMMRGIRNLLGQ